MGSSQNMVGVNQGASTHVYTLLRVLLEDSYMPGIFTKLTVTVYVDRVLDTTVDSWIRIGEIKGNL